VVEVVTVNALCKLLTYSLLFSHQTLSVIQVEEICYPRQLLIIRWNLDCCGAEEQMFYGLWCLFALWTDVWHANDISDPLGMCQISVFFPSCAVIKFMVSSPAW